VVQLEVSAKKNHYGTTGTTREFPRAKSMSRIRRYIAPALLLLPVIFICGKLLLTPVAAVEFLSDFGRLQWSDRLFEVGWPWVFQEIERTQDDVSRTISFSPWELIADCGMLLTATVVVGALTYLALCRRRRLLQISLRAALIAVAVIAAACGWWANQRYRYAQDQQWIERSADDFWQKASLSYAGPEWLRRLVKGIELQDTVFNRVTFVETIVPGRIPAQPERLSDWMPKVPDCSSLRAFGIFTKPGVIIDFPQENSKPEKKPPGDLSAFDRLELVVLNYFGDDNTLAELATLPRLRFLEWNGIAISTTGMEQISKCGHLESLVISGARISDDGIASLEKLDRLCELRIDELCASNMHKCIESISRHKALHVLHLKADPPIDDDDVKKLLSLPALKEIDVTSVSDAAYQWMYDFKMNHSQ
jgi:hypothetical protein